jgi:hypothetical protein
VYLYDVQTVANICNKAKKSLLEEKGVDTSSTKAQQLVDYLMTNPDTNAVIVIHDPSSALIGGRQKGRPNKKMEVHLVLLMKMSNKKASVEELVFDREYTVDIMPKHAVMRYTYQSQMPCYCMCHGALTKSLGWPLCLVRFGL